MNGLRGERVIKGIMGSIDRWIEECELIHAAYPPACHLLMSLRQARVSLDQIIERSTD